MHESISVRTASPGDLSFIMHLQRVFSESIGFLPRSKVIDSLEHGKVFLGNLESQEAGFLLFEPQLKTQHETSIIVQAAVQMDAQNIGVGLNLVRDLELLLKTMGSKILQASCREDLEANEFWAAAGFTAVAHRPGGGKRDHKVILWRKLLSELGDITNLPNYRHSRGPGGKFSTKNNAANFTLFSQ